MAFFGKKKTDTKPICDVVIAAAGSSQRMQGVDKLTELLDGEPVLVRSVRAFARCPLVGRVVVCTRPERIDALTDLLRHFSLASTVVPGGSTRTESVLNGLHQLGRGLPLVAIHDGARPLCPQQLIADTILRARICSAAAPAVPVSDTIKICSGDQVISTPDRSTLFAVQTPQVFDRDLIEAALEKAIVDGITLTDDCQAVERLGMHVHLVPGSTRNLKITTRTDLVLAAALLAQGDIE